MRRRRYTLGARADATAARRERVFAAAYELFARLPYDGVTLQAVAERSGVSLKTIVRQFRTKEGLVAAAARWGAARETSRRTAEPGDVTSVARVLAARYEQLADMVVRRIEIEARIPSLQASANLARESHLAWLAEVFADWLPRRGGRERTRRLLALFGATEIYVWWSWRRRLGASRADAAAAMRDTLQALLAHWSRK